MFTVRWPRSARNELAALWIAADSVLRQAITTAAHRIDQGLRQDPRAHLQKLFTQRYDEMVLIKDIRFESFCEHHLLPFIGVAHVAYLPNGKVVGLSKVPRVIDVLAKRPQMQERLCCCRLFKIPVLIPQNQIRDENGAAGDMSAQLGKFAGEQQRPTQDKHGSHDQEQCGKNSFHAPDVEFGKMECAAPQTLKYDLRYQVAGNHEENVDAGKSAGRNGWERRPFSRASRALAQLCGSMSPLTRRSGNCTNCSPTRITGFKQK